MEWVDAAKARILRISFAANVRYLRQAPKQDVRTDLTQLSFQIVAADESVLTQVVEEGRHLSEFDNYPSVDLTYVPQPKDATKTLLLRFSEKEMVQARQAKNARAIELVFAYRAPAKGVSNAPLPAMAADPAERHFIVQLQSPQDTNAVPHLPARMQDYALFTRASQRAGVKGNDLLLGYFKTEEDAQAVRTQLLKSYPLARVLPWRLEAPVEPPAPGAEAVGAAVAAVEATAPEVVDKGEAMLATGRKALNEQRYQEAVDVFNQALMLPPNPASRETQELIGMAWEGLNKPDKARIEYELYLKLYPEGADSERVARRLKSLGLSGAAAPVAAAGSEGAAAAKPPKSRYSGTGSISQYYYGGNTKSETLVNLASGIDQNTLNRTNQSVLVSSWDASGKYQGDGSETKIVMRGSHSDNLSDASTTTSATQGLISAAYVDYHHDASGLSVRAGRQSAIGGALFGLFDGVSAAMPFGDGYKADAMLGVPANTLINAPQQVLMGAMVEADNLFPHWGGSVSLVRQTTEGILDRQAVGLDTRYFGDEVSVYSQIDYDTNLNALNAFTLQGSVQGPWDTTITMMVDDRKAPSLQVSNALIGDPSGTTSLAQLVALNGLTAVQQAALNNAADAKQAMLSVSRALSPKWQGSVDFRYSEVGALPQVGNFQATPATGAQYNVSVQLTGSNLYSARDINGVNISYLTSDTLQGTQLSYNNLTGIWGSLGTLEPSIRYYTQTDNTDTKVVRISPGLRLSYKLSQRASLMGETIYESSQTDGPTNHETSTSIFFYVGYRYDFQ